MAERLRNTWGSLLVRRLWARTLFEISWPAFRTLLADVPAQYEQKLVQARQLAVREMTDAATQQGANAVVGVDIDYEVIRDGMLMVTACGTAVRVQ